MNSLSKKLGVLAVSSIITLGSYGYAFADEKKKNYSFDNFGGKTIHVPDYDRLSWSKVVNVTTADVDGDGDQDIILGIESAYSPKIIIIENKMPQKNKESIEKKK